ncbi:MAG: transaldolase, partial [Bacteroidota bacterium]
MNNLQQLAQLGQSIWYDNISRGLITKGELKKMVDEGLLGVTSNPTIFDKAISGSTDYDAQIRELVEKNPGIDAGEIIQALMVKDIQMACDVLRPVYDRTKGGDGFISIEVTPNKARDTKATSQEVRELWAKVNRPNLMVKIPSTKEGLPAIEQAIYEGSNINVTLIFSVERYVEVADAYIRGLERRVKEGKPVDGIASVASVFVSRIDTLVDELLAKKNADKSLMGKVAVANTKMVYQAFKQMFGASRFKVLEAKGARVQRPLWGSTGTKNPAYPDLLYVDTLIGPHTVNTVPPSTYTAILDHSKPAVTVGNDLEGAGNALAAVAAAGIDMKLVLQKLEDDGVAAFEKSFDGLYANLT